MTSTIRKLLLIFCHHEIEIIAFSIMQSPSSFALNVITVNNIYTCIRRAAFRTWLDCLFIMFS